MAGNQPIQIRLDHDTLGRVDDARGQVPRADYLRAALNQALDSGLRYVAGPRDETLPSRTSDGRPGDDVHATAQAGELMHPTEVGRVAAEDDAAPSPSPNGGGLSRGASGLVDPATPHQPGQPPPPMWDDDGPAPLDLCAHCGAARGMHQRGCPAA